MGVGLKASREAAAEGSGAQSGGIPRFNVNARFRVATSMVKRLNVYLTYRQHTLLSTVGRVPVDEMDLP
jgi:hypothetical protein